MSTKPPDQTPTPSTPGNFAGFLEFVKKLLGFLLWLVTSANVVMGLAGDPREARIASFAGFIFCFLAAYWFVVRPYGFDFKQKKVKTLWLWLGFLYVVSLAYFIWVGTWFSHRIYPVPPQPVNVHQRFDFESAASLEAWSLYKCGEDPCRGGVSPFNELRNRLRRGNRAFTGEHGLEFQVDWEPGAEHVYSVQHRLDTASLTDAVSARAYVSKVPANNHVQVAILAQPSGYNGVWPWSSFDVVEPGWHEVFLDLRRLSDDEGIAFNEYAIECLHIDFTLPAVQSQAIESIEFAIDDVALSRPLPFQLVHDQWGEGQTLFDFDKGHLEGWTVSSKRTATDTLTLSQEHFYRGSTSLELDTHLTQGGDTVNYKGYFKYQWEGSIPLRALVAHVYIPAAAPGDDVMWANIFADTSAGWQGSEPLSLTPGTWTALAWDTREVDWGTGEVSIGIQVGINHIDYEGPIYLDDFEVLEE